MLTREWVSAAELAAMRLPKLPGTKVGILQRAVRDGWTDTEAKGRRWRPRQGRGGGVEFHYTTLPEEARVAFIMRNTPKAELPKPAPKDGPARDGIAAWYETLPTDRK
ncbi:MAG: hypothetical protein K2X46_08575 [Roseomonas sp.]|nr:hypothetical protein [Roseomonas sp.]